MNHLDQAIQLSGGVGALAKVLGVPNQNSISMWRKRGRVPLPWMKLIEEKVLHSEQPPKLEITTQES